MVTATVQKVTDPADFINFYPNEIEADEWHLARLVSIKEGEIRYMEEVKPSWDFLFEFKDLTYINREGQDTHGQVKAQCTQTFTEKSTAYKYYCMLTGVEELEVGAEVDFDALIGRKCKVMINSTKSGRGNWFHKVEKISIKGLEPKDKVAKELDDIIADKEPEVVEPKKTTKPSPVQKTVEQMAEWD